MPKNIIFGLLLIGMGLVAFNYQSVSYKTRVKKLEVGTVQVTAEKTRSIPIPRLAGILALSGGIFLLFMNKPLKA